jgi:hypothetical protein
MLPALAGADDLATWLGEEISGTSIPRANVVLAQASTRVRTFTGRTWIGESGDIDEGVDELALDAARQVVVLVAARVWKNPHGRISQSTGPFSFTNAEWAAMGAALTDDEKEMLGGTQSSGIPGLTSFRVEAPVEAKGTRSSWTWCSELNEGDT